MRGHALSNTRKLNRHWQSGDEEKISMIWYDCAKINDTQYYFAPRYLPDPSSGLDDYIETVRISSYHYDYRWKVLPSLWDGTNTFSDEMYVISASGDITAYPITGDYYVLNDIPFIPHFGGIVYDTNLEFKLYYHDDNQTVQTLSKQTGETFNLLWYIADVYFVRLIIPYAGRSLLETRGPAYNSDNNHILTRFSNSVIKPSGFSPVWQQTKTDLQRQPYGMYTAVNSLLINTEQFTCDEFYVPTQLYRGVYQSVEKHGYNPVFNGGYGGQVITKSYAYPICQADAPYTFSSSYSNYIYTGVSGYSAPFCEYTDYDMSNSPYYNLAGWLRPIQTQWNNDLDNYDNYGYKYGLIISMKEIKAGSRYIYG